MTKILDASCVGGVVTAGGLPVPSATKLCEGVAPSTGILVMEEDAQTYIAKTSPDLKTTLEKVASALGQIITALTAIDAKPPGPLPPTPVAAANIVALTVLQTEITVLKGLMK